MRSRPAVVASAAVMTLAAVVGSVAFRVHPGWPPQVVPQLDLLPVTADAWGASWEALSRPASSYQRQALVSLIMTTAQLGLGTAGIAALSLVMHAIGRILSRWRALAIRCALGARLRHLMRLAAGELCLLGAIGCAIGAVLGALVAGALRAAWPALLSRPDQVLPAAASAVVMTIVVQALLAGVALLLLYPLQRGVRTVADLHGDHATTSGGMLLVQNTLAMLQMAGLLVVTYGSLLILRSASGVSVAGPLPYEPRTVSVAPSSVADPAGGRRSSHDAWVGLGQELPLIAFCGDCFIGDALVPMTSATVRVVAVADSALQVMSIQTETGRAFGPQDSPSSRRVAVLSHAAASQLFPGTSPLGRTVRAGFGPAGEFTVVGVVASIAPGGLGNSGAALPILYLPLGQVSPRLIETAVANYSVEQPSGFTSLAERLHTLKAPLRWFAAIFALLALASTGLGVYALATAMSEMVALRQRDIAIRLAIGAEPRHIVAWIAGKALVISGVGVVVGLSGARWLGDLLSRFLSASVISDLYTLAWLSMSFGLIALLASWAPARRASRMQPSAVFADPTA